MAVGATLTTLSNILKEYYLPPVVGQLNDATVLLSRVDKSDAEIFGKLAVVPLQTGRSGGVGARGEGQQLPDAGSQPVLRATYDLKYLYGRARVTGPSMIKTSQEAGSFLQALKFELDRLRADLAKDLARQVYGDASATILVATSGTGTTFVNNTTTEAFDKGQIYVGMYIDVITPSGPNTIRSSTTPGAYTTVSAVTGTSGTTTVTFNTLPAAYTVAASDILTRQGAVVGGSTAGTSQEVTGLQLLVSATSGKTVGAIDSSANTIWDNQRDTAGGALTIDRMVQMRNKLLRAGGSPSLCITSYGLQRSYFNLLQSQVRYQEPQTIKGGWSALDFFNLPVVCDLDAPYGKMYFLDESKLVFFSDMDWHVLDQDGDALKWVPNFDQWETILTRYLEFGIRQRNVQGVISGLTDSTGI